MSLPARPMHIPAGLPIDQASRPELLDVGRSNILNVNVRQNERGCLEHRLGFGELTTSRIGGTRTAGRRMFAHNGTPVVIDGEFIDNYIETAEINVLRGRVAPCLYRLIGLPTASAAPALTDLEYCNGYLAVSQDVSTTSGAPPQVAIIDAISGSVVRAFESVGAVVGIGWVASYGDRYFVAFVRNGSTTAITAYLFDTHALATGWTTLATVASTSNIAPSVCSLSNRVAIVYGTNAGTDRLTVKTYSAAGLLETRTIGTSSVSPTECDLHGSVAGTLWVLWDEANTIKACGLDADALATTLATTAPVLSVSSGAGALRICEGATAGTARAWVLEATSIQLNMCPISTVAGATSSSSATTVRNARPAGRPFQQGGRFYMPVYGGATSVTDTGNGQALCIVVDWTENEPFFLPVANIEPGLVSGMTPDCKSSPIGTTGKWIFGCRVVKSGRSTEPDTALGLSTIGALAVELDFTSRNRWQPVDHANTTFLGGGILGVYDGDRYVEAGFLVRPNKPTGSLGGTGITGDFRYVAIFEDIDSSGNWVVSGISEPSAVVTAANKTVTLSVPPLSITWRNTKHPAATFETTTRVAWYRTGGTGGEPPYYRIGVTPINPGAATVTFADSQSVADVQTRAKLYAPNLPGTAGESQDRRAPPGLPHIDSYSGMLVGAKEESLLYSGQEVYGEATWFSPAFEVPVTGGGDITGLRSQDGTLFIFKDDRIFAVAGEAPSDNGLQGGLGVPRLLASDVGCIEPNSLLVTSLGIFFQSRRGIELLTRSQTVKWIGETIQGTLGRNPVVTSAVLDARNGLARFALAELVEDGAVPFGSGGVTAVFDLTLKAWVSEDRLFDGLPSQSAASVYIDGAWRYAWLDPDGTVFTERDPETTGSHLDGTDFVRAQYTLPPWKMGLQQEQRIYEMELLFENVGGAGLRIDVAYNFSGDFDETKEWTEAELVNQRQVSFRPKSLTTAIQLRVQDTAPADPGTGEGLTFIGLSSDSAAKQGATRGTTRLNPGLRR